MGEGRGGLPRARCGHNDTSQEMRYKPGGRTEASAPTDGLLVVPCALPGVRKKPGRVDVGIGPYGSATRGAMGGRPQGSPLRKRYKGCGEAAGWGQPALRRVTRGAEKRADVGIGPYGSDCRGGRPCPPDVGAQYFCRAGPVCPAVGGAVGIRYQLTPSFAAAGPPGRGAFGPGLWGYSPRRFL